MKIAIGYNDPALVKPNAVARHGARWNNKTDKGAGLIMIMVLTAMADIFAIGIPADVYIIGETIQNREAFWLWVALPLLWTAWVIGTGLSAIYARKTSDELGSYRMVNAVSDCQEQYFSLPRRDRAPLESLFENMHKPQSRNTLEKRCEKFGQVYHIIKEERERHELLDDHDLHAADAFLEMQGIDPVTGRKAISR